jgi:hypothetical protein
MVEDLTYYYFYMTVEILGMIIQSTSTTNLRIATEIKHGDSSFVMGNCGITTSWPVSIPLVSITVKPSAKATPPASIKPTTRDSTKKVTVKPTFAAAAKN